MHDHRAAQQRYVERQLAADPEAYRAYAAAKAHAWRRRNPKKTAAHRQVYRAIQAGKLVRPEICEHCGESKPLDAHHDNYDQALAVRWLCRLCHKGAH